MTGIGCLATLPRALPPVAVCQVAQVTKLAPGAQDQQSDPRDTKSTSNGAAHVH